MGQAVFESQQSATAAVFERSYTRFAVESGLLCDVKSERVCRSPIVSGLTGLRVLMVKNFRRSPVSALDLPGGGSASGKRHQDDQLSTGWCGSDLSQTLSDSVRRGRTADTGRPGLFTSSVGRIEVAAGAGTRAPLLDESPAPWICAASPVKAPTLEGALSRALRRSADGCRRLSVLACFRGP
ncbi:hypothetical protein B0G82_4098 [Paraburkholderia sp. BL17N1]|nr:hypothetical protein B0G82_4098 [Paraburkholderia sp. BL17N1]